MKLADALGVKGGAAVAVVGGGGKTTAMFRLAREIVDQGGEAITAAAAEFQADRYTACRRPDQAGREFNCRASP